jgi:predicted dehydrogenase
MAEKDPQGNCEWELILLYPASPSIHPTLMVQNSVSTLRWGILSTGRIAGIFAQGLAASKFNRAVAVGSRRMETAREFAAAHGIARAHESYEALLSDPEVDAVYIGTPHPHHREWTLRAAAAGKHILCEKPMGMNHAEGLAMIQAARQHDVLLMEAFMYRCHPQTARIVDLIRNGALGRVCMAQAAFGYYAEYDARHRRWARSLGGGSILDLGCYPVSMARLVAGAAEGKPFLDPDSVTGAGHLHPNEGVDDCTAATLGFPSGFVAQVSASMSVYQETVVRIYGTSGWLLVPTPWVISRDGGASRLVLHRQGSEQPEEILIEAGPLYAIEADSFAAALQAGLKEVPAMSHDDTLGNLLTLDRWREAIGLRYEADRRR